MKLLKQMDKRFHTIVQDPNLFAAKVLYGFAAVLPAFFGFLCGVVDNALGVRIGIISIFLINAGFNALSNAQCCCSETDSNE